MVYIMLSFLIIISCSSGIKVVNRGLNSIVQSPYTLTLLDDSTFTYRYKFGPDYEFSNGYWEAIGVKHVRLNSEISTRVLSLKVDEKQNPSSATDNRVTLSIGIPDEEGNYYSCSVYVNGMLHKKGSCNSLIDMSFSKSIDSIFFEITADKIIPNRFLDTLRTEMFYPQVSSGNLLEVEVLYNDDLFNYRVFSDQLLSVPKKALKDLPVTLELPNPPKFK